MQELYGKVFGRTPTVASIWKWLTQGLDTLRLPADKYPELVEAKMVLEPDRRLTRVWRGAPQPHASERGRQYRGMRA